MSMLHIYGGIPLQGCVRIHGSKNAALPVLAATLLADGVSRIGNCPGIADVQHMVTILENLGCVVSRENAGIAVDAARVCGCKMAGEAITGMRSSLCLLGALIGRCGEVVMEYPGGCVIGARPIDLHLSALRQMGVSFSEEEGRLHGKAKRLHGARIVLQTPSVGATENVLLAAALAQGDTEIVGAAREPEIETLCRYLNACGAVVEGIGSPVLYIRGGRTLHGADFAVPADRIVAGTYLFACVGTGGEVFLEDAPCGQMEAVIRVAEAMGAQCQRAGKPCETGCAADRYGRRPGLYVQGPERPDAVAGLRTAVYPGFPTDLQSMALTVLTVAKGQSRIEETIFENRFRVAEPLRKMGADIVVEDAHTARIRGVEALHGTAVEAQELRGGAALVLAGLMADGESVIKGCDYIARGYENIGRDLRDLGARIASG